MTFSFYPESAKSMETGLALDSWRCFEMTSSTMTQHSSLCWHHLISTRGQNQIDSPVLRQRQLSQTHLKSNTGKAARCIIQRKKKVIVYYLINLSLSRLSWLMDTASSCSWGHKSDFHLQQTEEEKSEKQQAETWAPVCTCSIWELSWANKYWK